MKKQPAEQPAKTPQILIVDDNRQGLIARKALLEEQGYKIWTATGGEEALELFSEEQFDVVVTDYKMPRMNGGELIRRIRAIQAEARIILVSGYVDLLGLNEQLTGADLVITKNAGEVGNLIRSVKRLLAQPAAKAPARKPPASAASAKKPKAKAQ
jgi:CheY-like chemotaxis protein